jgi:DNA polymerase-3 subunit gamma/tau
VRDLRDKINFSPNSGRYKVYIVDEVHMLSTAAFNALLKTLEEPPAHAVFILATTEVHKIPATVLSRCQRHEFRRIPVVDIVSYLTKIADEEGIQVEPAALTLVARQATGAMRDAISLLDQLSSTGHAVTLEMAHAVLGTATSQSVLDLMEALIAHQADRGLDLIHTVLDRGSDPRQFARQVVEYLRNLLMFQMQNADLLDVPPDVRPQMSKHAQAFSPAELLHIIQVFNQAANDTRGSWMPSLPLEMAFVEAMQPPAVPVGQPSTPVPAALPAASPGQPAKQNPRVLYQPQPSPEVESKLAPEEADAALPPADPQAERALDERWKQILALTRQESPNTYGLLNSCKARQLKDGVLTLGFASDVLKFQMEKSTNLELVSKVLKQVFEQEITIHCVTLTGKRTTPPPGVDSDGMVASALRDLGGEIVDVH